MQDFPLLSVMMAIPLATAAFIGIIPKRSVKALQGVAAGGAGLTFLASLPLFFGFETGRVGFQFTERYEWIPDWGINYQLGVDGITLFLVLLATFIVPLAIVASFGHVGDRVKAFYLSVMLLETAMIGVFVALDLILFYVFFEVMLVPMYALIGVWGGVNRRYAAVKFFLYTLVGGLLMLTGILYLYFKGGAVTFDYSALLAVELSSTEELLLFLAFFAAFAIKVPVFPFHTWLPDAHTEAPTIGSVDLAAILLKIGGYGIIRFALPYFPDATQTVAPFVIVLSLFGIIYGALVAMMQSDIKRLVAYSSVSHMGFVTLGLFALTTTSASASVVQMVNHGLATGALFMLIGFMYERTHDRKIASYSGIMKKTPIFGGLFLVVVMSSIALPGLNGFTGEFPILLGTFYSVPWAAVIAVFGVILAALYMLWPYQRMFHGPVDGKTTMLSELNAREIAVIAPILVLLVGIGLYPKPLYDRVTPTMEAIIAEIDPEGAQIGGRQIHAEAAAADATSEEHDQ